MAAKENFLINDIEEMFNARLMSPPVTRIARLMLSDAIFWYWVLGRHMMCRLGSVNKYRHWCQCHLYQIRLCVISLSTQSLPAAVSRASKVCAIACVHSRYICLANIFSCKSNCFLYSELLRLANLLIEDQRISQYQYFYKNL